MKPVFRAPLWPSALPAVGGAGAIGTAVGISAAAASPLLPVGVLCGLAGLVTVLRSPLMAILAFVLAACLLPFAVIPVRIGVSLTLIDVALTLLLAVWVARSLRRRDPLATTPIDGLLVLFIGIAVASFVLGSGYAAIAGEQFRLFLKLVNSMLFFFGVVQVVRTERDLLTVLRALVLGAGAAGAIALVLHALPRDLTIQLLSALRPLGYPTGAEVIRTIAGTSTVRATGTSIDPNVLGGMLMIVGVIACAFVISPRPLLRRPLLLGLLVAILAAVLLSYSRSSWIGLAAGLGFIAGFRDRRAWFLVLAGVAFVALVPQGQILVERFTSGIEARDQAAAMRVAEYEDALALIARYPLLGVGFGESPTIELYVAVSSIYLLIAEEMGLLGLAVFVGMLATVLIRSMGRIQPGGADLRASIVGLQGALVAALAAGLFDHYFFNIRFPHMVALFWLVVALLLVSVRLQNDQRGARGYGPTANSDREL